MTVVSFFAGCGGLDLGFEQAGFRVIWANEHDLSIRDTYTRNHPYTFLSSVDIRQVPMDEIPESDGFVGGPPCQSWSVAGRQRGLCDERGQLFRTYIEIINKKKPKFFFIENVAGLLDDKFKDVFGHFLHVLSVGYDVQWKMLDAVDYGIPQNRKRVFLVGFRNDLRVCFQFPEASCMNSVPLSKAIGDIKVAPTPHTGKNCASGGVRCWNHDVLVSPFGPYYYRANRRRSWNQPSFTIHATAENAPLHPSSPPMVCHGHENWSFHEERSSEYRRLSVRECARIQTFPDSFEFIGTDIRKVYKMIGNAVPPRMARVLAESIASVIRMHSGNHVATLCKAGGQMEHCVLVGYFKGQLHHDLILRNLLYYVRFDGRRGSWSVKPDCMSPSRLLLHHGAWTELYVLSRELPSVVEAGYLRSLGFDVSGERYLCFRLLDGNKRTYQESDVREFPLRQGREMYSPYLTTMASASNKRSVI